MPVKITYKSNLPEKAEFFGAGKRLFRSARRSSLSSVGFFLMQEQRKTIENFPDSEHPLSKKFFKKYQIPGRFRRRLIGRSLFHFLGKFSRYRIWQSDYGVETGYGKDVRFVPFLEKIAQRVEAGQSIGVSPAMQKMVAASTGRKVLFRRGTTLRIKARSIVDPTFMRIKAEIYPLFEKKFMIALNKRYNE